MAEPKTNWFRPLKGDRMEVHLVGTIEGTELPVKVRASGPNFAIWRTVEFFEEITGREVVGEWKRPPRTGARPIAGQLTITEQLEFDGNGEDSLSGVRGDGADGAHQQHAADGAAGGSH